MVHNNFSEWGIGKRGLVVIRIEQSCTSVVVVVVVAAAAAAAAAACDGIVRHCRRISGLSRIMMMVHHRVGV